MQSKHDNKYFALKDSPDKAEILMAKAHSWFNTMETNGYLEKLRQTWSAFYGLFYGSFSESHKITFSGEQAELVNLSVNHLRNIGDHMINMITSVRPSMEARSVNTDARSSIQTKLANGILDYYTREKRLEKYLEKAVESAVVLAGGYIKLEWNATSGEIYDFSEELNMPIYEGDIQFTNLSPFDVYYDGNKEDEDADWVVCRSFKNRYDLIAKYPEFEREILNLPSKNEYEYFDTTSLIMEETDLVAIYEFYHKRTEAMPDGNYMLFVSPEAVLIDTNLPYRKIPVYRIAPSFILGTPYGYTPLFDLLPLQDAVNSLYSTILSNQNALGLANILSPRDADIDFTELGSGLNVIEYNRQAGAPSTMDLLKTPKELFDFLRMLEQGMETISGINSVTRGNPDKQLTSGNALALVQSMAVQFISRLQRSYVQLVEDVGTGIIDILKDYAQTPRIVNIVGKANKSYVKEFTGDDLKGITRVIVDVSNPLARCLAKGTEVLMFDGSLKKVEDIQIGDLVMGPDSKARTVENVNSGQEMMYEVTSKDKHQKVKYGCNESHILSLKYCSVDGKLPYEKDEVIDMTIKEYMSLPDWKRNLFMGFKTGVDFSEKKLEIPPYILGTWLGDGTSAATAITTMDSEIFKEWFDYAESIGMNMRTSTNVSSGKAKTYFITSGNSHGPADRNIMMNELRAMELINNKHIPDIYKKSSRQQRLELLAGLIDTDGSRNGETFIFTQKNDKLTEDIVYLSRSLGFRTTFRKRKNNTSDLVPNATGEVNLITIGGNTWEIPSRLPRKQSKPKSKARSWLNYGIKVTPIGEGTYYGFTLKEEPHFVLGDFTVTHNTTAGRVQMAEQMLQMKIITNPKDYMSVINTGEIESLTDDTQRQITLAKLENEKMMNLEHVLTLYTDDHDYHIKEHANLLADPDLRFDKAMVQLVYKHIQEHIDLLRSTDPDLLAILSQQPLGPQSGSPANQPDQNPNQGNPNLPPVQAPGQEMMPQEMGAAPENLPQPAQPPGPAANLPTNPADNIPQ